jgi:hypothetical protein
VWLCGPQHSRRENFRKERRFIGFDLHADGLCEAWKRGEREQFLVEGIEPAIRYTEGKSIGIKRGHKAGMTVSTKPVTTS